MCSHKTNKSSMVRQHKHKVRTEIKSHHTNATHFPTRAISNCYLQMRAKLTCTTLQIAYKLRSQQNNPFEIRKWNTSPDFIVRLKKKMFSFLFICSFMFLCMMQSNGFRRNSNRNASTAYKVNKTSAHATYSLHAIFENAENMRTSL